MKKGIIAAILASFCWALSTVLSKIALEHVDSSILFIMQLFFSVSFLWIFILIKRYNLPPFSEIYKVSLLGIFEPGIAYFLGLIALNYIGAGIATLIQSTETVLIIFLSFIILGIRPSFQFLVIITIMMLGLYLVLFQKENMNNNDPKGLILMFLAVLSAAFYVVLSSKFIEKNHPLLIVTYQQSLALILSLIILCINYKSLNGVNLNFIISTWIYIITSGVIQYALAFYLYIYSLSKIPVNLAGFFLGLMPVFGLTLAFLFLKESLTIIQLIGSALVVITILKINSIS